MQPVRTGSIFRSISPKGEYLDSEEIYQALTAYITDYLKTDTGFSKLLYKYLLMNDQITGQDICLVLYEQGVLSKEDDSYAKSCIRCHVCL